MDSVLIRAGRALLGWSQQDLAQRAGVQRLVVARYENGAQKPHAQNLKRLTSALFEAGVEQALREDGAIGVFIRADALAQIRATDTEAKEVSSDVSTK